jgi:mannose-6-phosphate isomerase-like protein (cupin superfamily)
MKFKLKNAFQFGWEGLKGWAYNSKDDFPNASAAYFEVNGAHGKIKTTESDRIYFVVEGKGEFVINGKGIPVEKTDVIIVPKNTPYDYNGIMKLFLIHSPAYDPEAEMKLE